MREYRRSHLIRWLESPRPRTGHSMSWFSEIFRRCALAAAVTVAALTTLANAAGAEIRDPHGVAVIIGNMDYRDKDVFDVTYAHRDAEAFKHYVLDIRGFDPKNVIELRDATRQDMFKAFGRPGNPRSDIWAHLNPEQGSDVIVYYSGHGVPGTNDRKGYLLPVDVRPDVAENDAYPIDLLYKKLGELDAANSVHVYLDACFSGGSHEGSVFRESSFVRLSPKLPKGASKKLTILTAASDKQVASWDREARHGLFTHYLLNALYGKGDSNDDGRVTGDEVKKYLDDYMTRAAHRDYDRDQTAVLIEGNQSATVLAVAPEEGFPARPSLTSPSTVVLQTIPENAQVRIDDVPYQQNMSLDPGTHEVVVEAQGHESVSRMLDLPSGTTEFRIVLCRLDSRTERICENTNKTIYRTEEETDTLTIEDDHEYTFSNYELAQIQPSFYRYPYQTAVRMLNSAYCEGNRKNSPPWRLKRILKSECEDQDGRLRRNTYDIGCDCNEWGCTAEGTVECEITQEVKVPETVSKEVCHDEPRVDRICPDQIVTQLR